MSVSLTFRCPDDLAELITSQVEATGKDKTSVLVGMLKQSLLALPFEQQNWELFKALCVKEGSSASEVLREFVNWYLAGNRLPAESCSKTLIGNVEQSLDDRITAKLDERGLKPENIKELLEEHTADLAHGLNAMLGELQAQVEELRGKL